jgi:hypothetical protein
MLSPLWHRDRDRFLLTPSLTTTKKTISNVIVIVVIVTCRHVVVSYYSLIIFIHSFAVPFPFEYDTFDQVLFHT